MKKFSKIYLPLLILAVTLLCLLGLSACGDNCEHVWKQGVTVNPGCEHEGAIAYTCEVCGEIKTELIDPKGHSFTNYVDDNNATCEQEGTKTAKCDNEDCEKTDTKSVPKRHVFSDDWTQSPDGHYHACTICGAAGETEEHDKSGFVCSVCGYNTHVHNPVKAEAKAPTCSVAGNIEYWYCPECARYYLDADLTNETTAEAVSIATIPHTFTSEWFSGADGHWHQCEVCNAVEPDSKAAHVSSGAATEDAAEICTVCNYVITPIIGHVHSAEYVEAAASTCTQNGNIASWYCAGCQKHFADEACTTILPDADRIIPAAHNAVYKEALEPTCFVAGHVAHWYCEGCDGYFTDAECENSVDYTLIAKPAPSKHTAITWVAGVPVGCEKDGNIAYWYCSACDKYFTDSAYTNEVSKADTVIAKTGHNPAYVGGKEATCTEKGNREYWNCTNCNKNYSSVACDTVLNLVDIVIDSLGHKQSQTPDEVIDPTCLEGGYSIFSCEREGCGYKIKNNYTPIGDCSEHEIGTTGATCQTAGSITYQCEYCKETRTVYTAKSDHNYETEVVAPTCTEAGYTKHTCKTPGCGYSFKDTEVAASGHSWSETRVEPGCTTAGSITTSCSGCGQSSVEAIPALGHDAAPTCEASGECSRCDYIAPATGHNYRVAEFNPATCTENGYVKYTCSNAGCEKPEITDYPAEYYATGHAADPLAVWTETEVAVEGEECTYQVVRTAPCAACGETIETRGEKYTEHKIVVSIKTSATCSVPGVKVHTCSVCETVLDDNVSYSDPEAHTWGEGVLQADGVTTLYTCACGLTKTSVSAKESTEAKVDSETVKNSDDVELKNATFVPDDGIKEGLTGEVEFGAEAKDKSEFDLDTEVLDRIGNNPIYDFTMTVDGTPATDLGGTMTVRIPYDLGDEDPENIMVWYINGEELTEVKATYVEIDGQGYAVFDTTHFSYYTVTKMKPAERCKLYGHNIRDIVVPATCLTDGYTMHVCTRCGETNADNFTEALGHEFQRNEETYVERTCSVNGYAEFACSRCGVDYVVRENAIGHDWVKDAENSTPATCETTGINAFKCRNCDATKEEYAPTLAHNYRTVVINPTCTEDGYTEKVCRDCGFTEITSRKNALGHDVRYNVVAPTCIDDGYTESHCARCDKQFENSSIVKSNGTHVWNLESASCTEDMVCVACGTRSAKATGHSFGTDGICQNEGCNERCAHNYSFLKDVPATCTKRAHKLHQCSICFGTTEVEHTGDPLPHEMENGVCKVCGLSSNTYYLAMLQSWKNVDGFALKVKDLTFSMEELVEEESPWYAIIGSADMKLAELMIYVDGNGNLAGAANGALTVTTWEYGKQIETYAVQAIIENGTVYIAMTQGVGEYGAEQTIYVSVTVDYVIGALVEEAVGLDRDGVAEILSYLDDKLIPIIDKYVDVNAEDIDDVIESLVNLVFTEQATDDGYVYVLDFDKIRAINNDLADLPIAEFIDKYFGESSFDNIIATVKEITGSEISALPALLDSYGFDSAKIISFINEVLAQSGEDFDIEDMLNSEDMKGVTVADLIAGVSYEEFEAMIDDMAEAFKNASLYDMIAGEDKENVRKAVSGVIDEISNIIYFSFSTDATRKIASLNIEIKDLSLNVGSDEKINLSVSVEFIANGRIDVNFNSIIDEINDNVIYPEIDPEEGAEFNYKPMDGEYTVTVGGVEYKAQAMMGYAEKYSLDYSDPIATMIMDHCGTKYLASIVYIGTVSEAEVMVYMLENGWLVLENEDLEQTIMTASEKGLVITYPDGSNKEIPMEELENSSMSAIIALGIPDAWYGEARIAYESADETAILYDTATGEYEFVVREPDLHDFVLDETKSVINDECGTFSYLHYVCDECDTVRGEYDVNYHSVEHKTVLPEGVTNCEDGLLEIEYCTKCNEILYSYEVEDPGHRGYSESVWDADNKTLYYVYECACGYENDREHSYTVDYDGEVEYTDLETDHSHMMGLIKFTASESGVYQFYGKNTGFSVYLYDAEGNSINAYGSSSGENKPGMGGVVEKPDYDFGYGEIVMSAGSVYELTAGETYYARINRNMSSEYSDNIITIELRESTEYSLADFGCTCGATMTVYNEFGRDNVSFSGCSDGCALRYEVTETTEVDDECREARIRKVIFYTESGEKEFAVSTYYTGNFKHNSYGRSNSTRTEAVGDDGQLVIIETYNYYTVCSECGSVTYKEVDATTYDKKSGVELGRKYESYVLNREGELTLERREDNRYAVIDFADGSSEVKCVYSEQFYYNRVTGEVRDGYSHAYTYYPNNKCLITVKTTDNFGNVREYTEYDHDEWEKVIEEESGISEIVDAYGRKLTVVTEARETYCTTCYASITKNVTRVYSTEDESYVKREYEHYEQYALSEDVYGYVLSNVTYSEYGYAIGYDGRSYEYRISDYNAEYEEGELAYWYKNEFRYVYGDYCHYDNYYSNIYNPEARLQGEYIENHKSRSEKYELMPGASSCDEGLNVYAVCNLCGYSEFIGERHDYGHPTYNGNRTSYDLSDYGSTCGGTLTVYTCPCGERQEIRAEHECDFEQKTEHISIENGYGYRTVYSCAVTDPLCGFSYVDEYRYYAVDNCKEYYLRTVTVGSLVISYGYETGSFRHSYQGSELESSEYVEDGLTVHENGSAEICSACGFHRSNNIYKEYFDADKNPVKRTYTRTNFNENGMVSYVEEEEYVYIKSVSGKETRDFLIKRHVVNYNSDGEPSYEEVTEYDRFAKTCPYAPLVKQSNSYGEYYEEQREHEDWVYNGIGYDPAPTCTQFGCSHEECPWCGERRSVEVSPYDHDFYEAKDEVTGEYYYACYRCGLVSAVGNNGSVSVEDLSKKLGNGNSYVVGYWNKDALDYIITIALVVEGSEEFVELEANYYDDGSKIYVTVDELVRAIEAKSLETGVEYSLCKNSVRIVFLPIGGSDFDYSITFDPHVLVAESEFYFDEELDYIVKTHTISCTLCDYTEGQENCNFSYSNQGGKETYTCTECGSTYRIVYYTSNEGCNYTDHVTYEKYVMGEWIFVYDRINNEYEDHKYEYTFSSVKEGTPWHVERCLHCGKEYETTCSQNEHLYREDVIIEDVIHERNHYRCACGYEFFLDTAWCLDDPTNCYYAQKAYWSYNPEKIDTYGYRYDHEVSYRYDEGGNVYIADGVCPVCEKEITETNLVGVDFDEDLFEYELAENPNSNSYFTLKLTAKQSVRVVIQSFESTIDTYGALYNADWKELVSNDDYSGRDFGFEFGFEEGETYYLVARPLSDGNYGRYTVFAYVSEK